MPTAAPKLPAALRALLEAAGALVRRAPSGRVALARAAPLVDPAGVPKAMAGLPRQLETARAEACVALDPKHVTRALKRLLDDWEPEPLAVRPAAQVHRGTRDDGTAVAVKVQRPGLAQQVRSDLALLDALVVPLRQVFGAMDAGAVLRELREAALDELDLENEASNQRQARRVLRAVKDVVVPAPDLGLSGDAVLVAELLEGPTLEEAEPEDPAGLARTLVAAHVTAARGGIALTDPRPAHVVLLGDGRVGLLGAGVARPLERARVEAALEALAALRAGDQARVRGGGLRVPGPAARGRGPRGLHLGPRAARRAAQRHRDARRGGAARRGRARPRAPGRAAGPRGRRHAAPQRPGGRAVVRAGGRPPGASGDDP